MENVADFWHVAGLLAASFAAWYIQYLIRWAEGPFGILDGLRKLVFGVVITPSDEHIPARKTLAAVEFLECSRCVSFWVAPAVLIVWYFVPVVVVALGIMGAASKIDDM